MGIGVSQQTARGSEPVLPGATARPLLWIPVAIALALAMILAGSSTLAASRALIVFSAAWAALIAVAINSDRRALPRAALVLGLAIPALPLLQVLPLPLALTVSLPGHDPVARAAAFLETGAWRPFSLDVERTWASFLSAGTCVALFWATVMLGARERLRIVHVVLAVALAGLLLGVAQTTSGGGGLYFQPDAVPGTLTGFFGNRNHEGALLAMAATLAIVLIAPEDSRERKLALLALALVFASGAVATRSRAAILLLAAGAALLVLQRVRARRRAVLPGLAAGAVLFALVWLTPVGHSAFERFLGVGGAFDRLLIWRESLVALRAAFPVGTGMGTFAQAYAAIEPLEDVSRTYINHAHSEVLQVPIEAGLPGVLVVLGILGFWLSRLVRLGREGDRLSQGVLGCLALPLLHSLADYPLRAFAMGAVASVLLAFAFPAAPGGDEATGQGAPRRRLGGLALLGGAMIAFVVQQGAAALLAGSGQAETAVRVMPFSARAHLARSQELAGEEGALDGAARDHAARALWLNAYSSRAWVLLGYTELQRGNLERADEAFLSASRLGWRDHLAQAYVFQRAAQTGAAQTAADAADALLRRDFSRADAIMDQMAALLADGRFREALAARMSERPPWRQDFIDRLTPSNRADAVAQLRFFQALARQGYALRSRDALAYLDRTEAEGGMDTLMSIWSEHQAGRAGDPRRSPIDSTFQIMDGSLFPFGWLPDGDRVSQALRLGPGYHEPTFRLRGVTGGLRELAAAYVRCGSARRDLLSGDDRGAFVVPARRCASQVLSVPAATLEDVAPGSIEMGER